MVDNDGMHCGEGAADEIILSMVRSICERKGRKGEREEGRRGRRDEKEDLSRCSGLILVKLDKLFIVHLIFHGQLKCMYICSSLI